MRRGGCEMVPGGAGCGYQEDHFVHIVVTNGSD